MRAAFGWNFGLGLGTRFVALGLLVITAVIQFLVCPSAYPTHAVWATGRRHLEALIKHVWFDASRA